PGLARRDVHIAAPQDLLDVLLGLRIRRDSAVVVDGALPRVVRRESEGDVGGIAVEQVAEMADAALDVLARIQRVAYPERRRRTGHELHEPLGTLGRHRPWVEGRFGLDDGGPQRWSNAVPRG